MSKSKWIMMSFLGFTLILTCALGAEAQQKVTEKTYVIRQSTEWPPTYIFSQMMTELEKTIPEKTNGRVRLENYFGGTLYTMLGGLEAIQQGSLGVYLGGMPLAAINPEWDVLIGLPFLFNDEAHLLRFQRTDAYKALCNRLSTQQGIKTLTRVHNCGEELWFNKRGPAATAEDLKGLKIALSPFKLYLESAKLLGLNVVQIPLPEISSSIETGVIDGTVGPIRMVRPFGLERTKHITRFKMRYSIFGIIASEKFWNTMPTDLQNILQPIFEDTMDRFYKAQLEADQKDFEWWKTLPGATMSELTPSERARCMKAVEPMYESLRAKDPKFRDLIDAAKSTR